MPSLSSLGIGRDVAKALVACGAETFALSRTQADLDSLKQEVILILSIDCAAARGIIQLVAPICLPFDLLQPYECTLCTMRV